MITFSTVNIVCSTVRKKLYDKPMYDQIPVTIEDAGVYPEIENAFKQAGYAAISQSSTS